MNVDDSYSCIMRHGDFVAPPDIRGKANFRSTQKKRRLTQRRRGKKGGKRK